MSDDYTALQKVRVALSGVILERDNLQRRNQQLEATLADAIGSLRIVERRLGRVSDMFTAAVLDGDSDETA